MEEKQKKSLADFFRQRGSPPSNGGIFFLGSRLQTQKVTFGVLNVLFPMVILINCTYWTLEVQDGQWTMELILGRRMSDAKSFSERENEEK